MQNNLAQIKSQIKLINIIKQINIPTAYLDTTIFDNIQIACNNIIEKYADSDELIKFFYDYENKIDKKKNLIIKYSNEIEKINENIDDNTKQIIKKNFDNLLGSLLRLIKSPLQTMKDAEEKKYYILDKTEMLINNKYATKLNLDEWKVMMEKLTEFQEKSAKSVFITKKSLVNQDLNNLIEEDLKQKKIVDLTNDTFDEKEIVDLTNDTFDESEFLRMAIINIFNTLALNDISLKDNSEKLIKILNCYKNYKNDENDENKLFFVCNHIAINLIKSIKRQIKIKSFNYSLVMIIINILKSINYQPLYTIIIGHLFKNCPYIVPIYPIMSIYSDLDFVQYNRFILNNYVVNETGMSNYFG